MTSGLSLLLLRPHLLLTSLHHLIILLGLKLSSAVNIDINATTSTALSNSFVQQGVDERNLDSAEEISNELAGELVLVQEIMDKVRGLESKVDYQVKKLIGLADAEEARGKEAIEAAEDGELLGISAYYCANDKLGRSIIFQTESFGYHIFSSGSGRTTGKNCKR